MHHGREKTIRFLAHQGKSIVVEYQGERRELHQKVGKYIKRHVSPPVAVERWAIDDDLLNVVTLRRSLLPGTQIPLSTWRIGEG